MENSLLVGLSRQMVLSRELEVVANNIANLNTNGFKADNSMFEEYLMPLARENRFGVADRRVSFVNDLGTWHDMRPGSVQQTGNPLDIAIDGSAFLEVQTPAGLRYTRNGALQINAQGQLVTADGSPVMGENGPIVFQQLDRNVSIAPDGRITVNDGPDSRTESVRGKLRLVSFAQMNLLEKDGATNFAPRPGAVPAPVTNGRVIQGALEKSNVSPVLEMTRMIEITRAYTQVSQLLQQESDLRKNAIGQLANVPN
jgi:flagellar basal-body rod protein FlgF